MSTVLASGADERYGWWLLNLIGSVHASSPRTFDAIVLYDLGLSPLQRRLAASIRGAEVRTVPEFVPHWREGRTWKLWVMQHLEADRLVWLDAGATVLRPLDEALAQIDERGYWVVSQGHPIGIMTPSDYWGRLGIDPALAERETIAAGILGFARESRFFTDVVGPAYEDGVAGLSVGFSPGDLDVRNYGLDHNPAPPVRDCTHFRFDQTVLNLRFHAAYDDPVINDLHRFAGTTPHDDLRQVIWAHRRRGDHRFQGRVPYRMPAALLGKPIGLAVRGRWWLRLHRWLFRPRTYTTNARRLVDARRRP